MLVANDLEDDELNQRAKPEPRGTSLIPRVAVDELVLAARHLADRDKALMRAVYECGLPLRRVAAATDVRSHRLRHRLRRILRRLRSPMFQLVARQYTAWPPLRRKVAHSVILQGLSQRAVARTLGITIHRLRVELERIRALVGAE